MPILLGPANQARDDLFRMIVSKAKVKVLSVDNREERHIYALQIETFDLESLLARTLVGLAVIERVATVPITPTMVQSVPFIEMHRLALLPDAPRKTVHAELSVVRKDGQWVVEPTQAFVVALFGFEASKSTEKPKETIPSSASQ